MSDSRVSRGLERQLQLRRNLLDAGHLSPLLAEHGETIRAGELVICGSVVPPIALSPANIVEFELDPMEPISVTVH